MKKFLKKIAGGLLCLAIMAGLSPSADAYYYCKQTIIADPQSPHIEKIMEDIDRQRFESEEQREQVKEAVSYLLFDSGFSAINQGAFPYYNYNSYAEKVSDGNYTFTVWAAGCYAYAKWASQLCYGDGMSGTKLYIKNENGGDIKSVWNLTPEGVKDFLRNNCQAGEHMRIDYVHSLCFLACSDEGVYFADYAGDAKPYIRLCFASYDAFFNAIRTGSSFWLSDVVSIENEGELEEDVMPEPEPEPEPEITKISLCINDPLITVNGETYPIDALGTTPLIRNDRTLLPISC